MISGARTKWPMLPIIVLALSILTVRGLTARGLTVRADACPLELPTTTVSINGHQLIVEWAASPQSRACGLSHRSVLDEDHGMLFVYPNPEMRTYWMKDTWIPLSIAFLDESGKILNIEIMSPNQTEKRYRSRLPAEYALEVNQGWFRLHGVKVGDKVDMTGFGLK